MASFSSTPSSFSPPTRWAHDVYLSFMKPLDACNDFAFHLYLSLDHQGIKTFTEDVEFLPAGKAIASPIFKAIEQSRISVVIISKNYASSPWCLSELVKIVDCQEKMNQIVLPVFYGIDPSEVRKQIGLYANPFAGRGLCNGKDTVERCRSALKEVENIYANPFVRLELCHGRDTHYKTNGF